MNHNLYIEVSIYRLKEGVSETDFLKLSDQLSDAFRALNGYQHRDLMRSADNQWVDLVYWEDEATAKANEEVIYANPLVNEIMGLLDTEKMVFTHVNPVKHYAHS